MESFVCAAVNPHLITQNLLVFNRIFYPFGVWGCHAGSLVASKSCKLLDLHDFVKLTKNILQTLLEFIVIAIYELLKECISSNCFSLDTIVNKPGKL